MVDQFGLETARELGIHPSCPANHTFGMFPDSCDQQRFTQHILLYSTIFNYKYKHRWYIIIQYI